MEGELAERDEAARRAQEEGELSASGMVTQLEAVKGDRQGLEEENGRLSGELEASKQALAMARSTGMPVRRLSVTSDWRDTAWITPSFGPVDGRPSH